MQTLDRRSIFISDFHLGSAACRADYLLEFLRHTESDYLYLVGDIFDLWSMRRSVHWKGEHSAVIQTILHKARKGTRVIYIPGNHDEAVRDLIGSVFHGIHIQQRAEHTTLSGRRLLVSHGDEFDGMVTHNRLARLLGDSAYKILLRLNRPLNAVRAKLGYPYWSLSAHIKGRVGMAREYVARFEQAAVGRALAEDYDGFVCGHIHKAALSQHEHLLYANCGDWVEHCTAITEDMDGNLELLHWPSVRLEAPKKVLTPVFEQAA
ncbi:UDP-2,3-diacylglucosamine pyrophosphatase LpxH [Ectothiorhodosinus mongolicus]|uniref:UDP-2,3-diacylglucosamine pyrophosphatase LpxH n=1 Tax=Ectothiorhodosinus mongolicus TaxID=233100 RepID=A0A1R3VW80_9GAMM|nr:UDP-2,3-diacylglucosamine diphosphatase [Ectothiorhodosinus mongolicus]ULX56960.1 UDP-2,3-diacylglucosamine diphosphatase [Ectothiorhodosinus mongolicus]SIT69187.1 UDP-2,3-diacylglucosamine pyrophosphatase LpxH [Ectothiorhodosinus mongolicus]